MSAGWLTVLAIGAVTIAIKAAGPVLLGGRQLPPRVLSVVALLPAALLAALVGLLTVGGDRSIVADARLVGVGVAAVLLWLRLPILVTVIAAAAAATAARALGMP